MIRKLWTTAIIVLFGFILLFFGVMTSWAYFAGPSSHWWELLLALPMLAGAVPVLWIGIRGPQERREMVIGHMGRFIGG
ncbi:MAG: hypothetical protein M5U26_13400 [Planctomycetota bacterium]|nr:hypothetical protein [Planctomycetota bacterium]